MTILEALKSGQAIKRKSENCWYGQEVVLFTREAILADDWQVEPAKPIVFETTWEAMQSASGLSWIIGDKNAVTTRILPTIQPVVPLGRRTRVTIEVLE